MSQADLLLGDYLKKLRMPAVASNYAKIAEDAAASKLGYVDYLLGLIEAEICQRKSNMRKRRLSAVRFPLEKTLDTLEFGHLPKPGQGDRLPACRRGSTSQSGRT